LAYPKTGATIGELRSVVDQVLTNQKV